MLIPKNKRDRRDFFIDVVSICNASRAKRTPYYQRCMELYMYGGDPTVIKRSNKIKPTINRQASFLFAPHMINFWLDIPPDDQDPKTFQRMDAASDGLGLAWHDSNSGNTFRQNVLWGLILGCTIHGVLPRKRTNGKVDIRSHFIHPRDFGVWEDGQPQLEEQEAVSLTSYLTWPQIDRMLSMHPRKTDIKRALKIGDKSYGGQEGDIRLAPNATTFNIDTQFWQWYSNSYDYKAVRVEPQFQVQDTYIFDDDLEDYRIVTTTGDEVIWERPLSFVSVPGVLPFVKVCADEHPEYFWGVSLVDDLSKLQMWYCSRMDDLDTIIQKVTEPPVAAIGVGQGYEEKVGAYRRRKGEITLPQGADIKSFQPNIPPQLFEFVQGIDTMLMEQAGMRPNMMGKNDPGTRTEGMASSLLRVAASEMLGKSYTIEGNAEDVGQLLFGCLQRYCDDPLIDDKGESFLYSEFAQDVKVRVDGHSTSPLFVQDNVEMAQMLKRNDTINDEMFLRMLHPAMESRARHDLRLLGEQKEIARQIVKQEQELKRSGGKFRD
jgi:hypothetical protein